MLIDVAITGDRCVIKRDAEKVSKYEDLIKEIQCMWNVRAKVIPVTIWAAGTISKSFRKYLSNIPVKGEIKELQTYRTMSVRAAVFLKMNSSFRNM